MSFEQGLIRSKSIEIDHHWGIILAGGDGNRLKDYTERLYGYHRPKQFCALIGTRSLFKHTIARAQMLIPFNQIFTVVSKHHCNYFSEELTGLPLRTILVQPCSRGTSAGILYPMLKIHRTDPDAVVSIFPSDHFIEEEELFMKYVHEAKLYVDRNPDSIVMLGVRPERIETGYGWIECEDPIPKNGEENIYYVNKFWEKPTYDTAEMLLMKGSLLNTFVLVGKSSTFIKYIDECIPDVLDAFDLINQYIDSGFEKYVAESIYHEIPDVNFSKCVLEKISEHLRVMEVTDIYWSDWGEESRVERDVNRFNNRNRLPETSLSKKKIYDSVA
jgi:mannose-1-phosphate guanylyltransferase